MKKSKLIPDKNWDYKKTSFMSIKYYFSINRDSYHLLLKNKG